MSDVAIVGVGIYPFGRHDVGYEEMGAKAASDALKDAGVQWADIQAAYLARMYLPATSRQDIEAARQHQYKRRGYRSCLRKWRSSGETSRPCNQVGRS